MIDDPLHFVIYISTASRAMTDEELLTMLDSFRSNNRSKGITGMLVYRDSQFLQMLEGSQPVLTALLEKIHKDPRHGGVVELLSGPAEKRSFLSWTMGFCNMEKVARLPDFPSYINKNVNLREFAGDAEQARQFLLSLSGFTTEYDGGHAGSRD